MADIKQETIQTVDPMLTCIFDKAGNVVAGGKLVSTYKFSLRDLVERVERSTDALVQAKRTWRPGN